MGYDLIVLNSIMIFQNQMHSWIWFLKVYLHEFMGHSMKLSKA